MNSAKSILKEHNLRVTLARIAVLDYFIEKAQVLSHSDLERSLGDHYDRVTLYRTLNAFLEHQIIHKVPGEEHNTKYALNTHHHEQSEEEKHAHFKCNDCGKLLCLPGVEIQKQELPNGFEMESSSIILSGTCAECNR